MKKGKVGSRRKSGFKPEASGLYEIVDFENLDCGNPLAAIRRFPMQSKPRTIKADLFIAGGGCGAVAAALSACQSGLRVCLVEPSSWLGGQLTAQGVSALDENYLVETSGATLRYKRFRDAVRQHYKRLGSREGLARFEPFLDPGNCWVSRLAFEPKVAVRVISEFLKPYLESGLLQIALRTHTVDLRIEKNKVKAALCLDADTGNFSIYQCRVYLDATETGDLLPMAGIPYSSGAESRLDTGEEHAPPAANRENVQDFTYPFVIEYCPGESHKIDKPADYDEFDGKAKFSLLNYRMFEEAEIEGKDGTKVRLLPFWEYRRLIDKANFSPAVFPRDLSMINWESNDLRGENIIDKSVESVCCTLARGKNLSLGFLYWLQNRAPRDDGGNGYPEFKLRYDVLGTVDGVSKYPYIRESRRIKSARRIVESDITVAANSGARARLFNDSLGIGHYPVDVHGEQDVPGVAQVTRPFQIPAFAFLAEKVTNLLPACKNIGCTHITNGAYRLHPIEWAIGEAAGLLSAQMIRLKKSARRIAENRRTLRRLQLDLLEAGSPLFWFDDVSPEDPHFVAVQFVVLCGLLRVNSENLHFGPDENLQAEEFNRILSKLRQAKVPREYSMPECAQELVEIDSLESAANGDSVRFEDLILKINEAGFKTDGLIESNEKIRRADFAGWLFGVLQQKRYFGRY